MNVIYRGRVTNGKIVLEGGTTLPEGTTVDVEPVETLPPVPLATDVYKLGELAVPTGIPDLAVNIDHYLYGHPKADGS